MTKVAQGTGRNHFQPHTCRLLSILSRASQQEIRGGENCPYLGRSIIAHRAENTNTFRIPYTNPTGIENDGQLPLCTRFIGLLPITHPCLECCQFELVRRCDAVCVIGVMMISTVLNLISIGRDWSRVHGIWIRSSLMKPLSQADRQAGPSGK